MVQASKDQQNEKSYVYVLYSPQNENEPIQFFCCPVTPSTTIGDIKKELFAEWGIPIKDQTLKVWPSSDLLIFSVRRYYSFRRCKTIV